MRKYLNSNLNINPRAQPYPRSRHRGQSLVELALTLPVLLLLLVGVLDLGRVYFAHMTLTNASREGARYATSNPNDTTGIYNHAIAESQGSGIVLTPLSVSIGCASGCTSGNPVRVTVIYDFQLMTTYLFGGGAIRLSAYTEFVVF